MTRAAARATAPRTASTPRSSTAPHTSARTSVTGSRGTGRSGPRPDLRLVPTGSAARPRTQARSALRSRKAPFVILVVALLGLTTLGLLVLNTAIAVDSLKASSLRADNAARAQEVQRLEQLVVAGSTPAEVARAAVAAGLVPAGVAGYLVLGPEGTTTMRGNPEPAPAPEPPLAAESTAPGSTAPAPTAPEPTAPEPAPAGAADGGN
ncbi:hypothetical protein [Blastococcus xanthinilyticus]|uniref:Cell division protein FtsL n=1 Tax=Blastococcus xanthinilyticus TaxID=1564164 RepID=A0A5S5CX18_9ACTN|nr:hypothetical protein [Blastococcus xanthinilyticus]TYP88317.1 hypothetical protein BD833_10420 [Blastococcus xanthinilyticus]